MSHTAPSAVQDHTSDHHEPEQNRKRLKVGEFGWIWIATIGIFILSAIIAPGSVNSASLVTMLPFAGILAIASVGQTLVIQQRGLDLSVPGIMTMAGIVMGQLSQTNGALVGIVVALAAALIAGVINGLLVSKLSITPLVATLASNALILGVVLQVSQGFPVSASESLTSFARGKLLGVPYSVLIALIFIIVATVLMKKGLVGRRFIAVGDNGATARAAGVRVTAYQVGTYAAAAGCYAIAGILLTGFVGAATTGMGNAYLLPTITAVVVGGTPFTGGRGSVIATAVAALFLTQLNQLVLSLGAPAALQLLIQAAVLVIAVGIRRVSFHSLPRRPRRG